MQTNYTDQRDDNARMITIRDEHSKGATINCDSVWLYTDTSGLQTLGFDAGDCMHSVNAVEVDSEGKPYLSIHSFGGTFDGYSIQNWDVEREGTVVVRESIESETDLVLKRKAVKVNNLEILTA